MELFKLRVQNIQGVLFSFFFSLLINFVRRKFVSKASERLLFSLFIINQYCTPNACYIPKNGFMTSDRLLFSLLRYFFNTKKCVFKGSGNLLFSLLNYFSNMKKMCLQIKWKPATFLIRKMCVQNKRWAAFQFIKLLFVIQKMCVQNKRGAAF